MGEKSSAPQASDSTCKLTAAAISLLAGKWTIGIILNLIDGKQRFGALQRRLPGISHHVLTKELKKLQRNEIVPRTVYPTTPPGVEYELSNSGVALCHVLHAVSEWAAHHLSHGSLSGDTEITK